MSTTKTITLNSSFVAFAGPAGAATFEATQADLEWAVLMTTDGSAFSNGNRVYKGDQYSLELGTGEYLHLRGRGEARLTAENEV